MIGVLTAIGAILLLAAGPLFAQPSVSHGLHSPYSEGRATVTAADLPHLFRTLDLDDEQRMLVSALHEGYAQAVGQGAAGLREALDEFDRILRHAQDQDHRREIGQRRAWRLAEWRNEQRHFESLLFEDVRGLLTPEQESLWPSVERDHRRRLSLALSGRLSGEKTDLIALVDDLDLEDESRRAVAPALEQYAVELDTLLVLRNELIDEMLLLAAEQVGVGLNELMARGQAMLLERHAAVRDANLRHVEFIAQLLHPERASIFRERFEMASFPEIRGPSIADERIEQALALESLTDTQRAGVEQVRGRYRDQRDPIDRELIEMEMWRQTQETVVYLDEGGGMELAAASASGGGDPREEQWRRRWSERRILDRQSRDEVDELLSPAQLTEMNRGPRSPGGPTRGEDGT